MTPRLTLSMAVAAALAAAYAPPASAQAAREEAAPHQTVFYDSGGLRIEAYLYRPAGEGPFPVVVYNHGSRAGEERSERLFAYIGRLLTDAGYAVLVPERRGYGRSEGKTFSEEVGKARGASYVARLQAETGDVLAAAEYLKEVPEIDGGRVAVMGWSFGGIVSVLAASRSERFFAVVDQAGGSLSWSGSPELRAALPDAARRIHAPLLCQVAENDATTAAVKAVCEAARKAGAATTLKIYPPFTPAAPRPAAGHAIFSAEGVKIWGLDVVAFLEANRSR